MALIFAQKNNYEINFNQELLAMGLANFVGSCFSALPLSASLSRSAIQVQTGGRTQVASIVSISILACVLMWIGPFFQILPKVSDTNCILYEWHNYWTNQFHMMFFLCVWIVFKVCAGWYHCGRIERFIAPNQRIIRVLENVPVGCNRLVGHIFNGRPCFDRYRLAGGHHLQFGLYFHSWHETVYMPLGTHSKNRFVFGYHSLQSS